MRILALFISLIGLSPTNNINRITVYVGKLPSVAVKSRIPDVEAIAKLAYYECRGESKKGIQYFAQVIINRANRDSMCIEEVIKKPDQFDGYNPDIKHDIIDKRLYNICKEVYLNANIHSYYYYLNPKTSTDTTWLNYALKQNGVYVDNHYFF